MTFSPVSGSHVVGQVRSRARRRSAPGRATGTSRATRRRAGGRIGGGRRGGFGVASGGRASPRREEQGGRRPRRASRRSVVMRVRPERLQLFKQSWPRDVATGRPHPRPPRPLGVCAGAGRLLHEPLRLHLEPRQAARRRRRPRRAGTTAPPAPPGRPARTAPPPSGDAAAAARSRAAPAPARPLLGHLAAELRDLREPPEHRFDRGGEDVVPADDEHVVDRGREYRPPAGRTTARRRTGRRARAAPGRRCGSGSAGCPSGRGW